MVRGEPDREPVQIIPPQPAPIQTRNELALLGILGAGKGRLALINGASFAEQESGTVRVGTNRVTIQCLKIQDGSVVVRVEGEEEDLELQLAVKP